MALQDATDPHLLVQKLSGRLKPKVVLLVIDGVVPGEIGIEMLGRVF